MGCFSFLCKKCGKPINSDSFRGQRAILYLLKNGEVIERMSGEYDSYGRVFDEKGESFHWNIPWSDVCKLMFDSDISNGICAIHEKCWKEGDIPVERSNDDENQGWGSFKLPKTPFIPATRWVKSGSLPITEDDVIEQLEKTVEEKMTAIRFIGERYDEIEDIVWGRFGAKDNIGEITFEIPISDKKEFEVGARYRVSFTKIN